MTPTQWRTCKFFSEREAWGDPELISPKLVEQLEELRVFIGSPIVITSGTQGVHKGSEHGLGHAADMVFPNAHRTLVDILFAASRFDFTGIGIYPHWRYNGRRVGGLHLDVRDSKYRAYWMAVLQNKQQVYVELSMQNLRQYGLLK